MYIINTFVGSDVIFTWYLVWLPRKIGYGKKDNM